jgi:predicted amidohydrolase
MIKATDGTLVAAVIQMRSGRDVAANIDAASTLIRQAAAEGATYIQTPEMTNLLERSREELFVKIRAEREDPSVAVFAALAAELQIVLHVGSLAIRTGEDKAANRGFLFGPDGAMLARYDKIHMFDVDLPNGESWRESATYQPGEEAIVVPAAGTLIGLGICYDIRFPALFRAQAGAGARVLTAPAAFTRQTGEAHWHVLQRARAIETGSFILAPAQGGKHEDGRKTWGHSMVIGPWGEIIAHLDHDEPGVLHAEIDLDEVASARSRIPSLRNDREFTGP